MHACMRMYLHAHTHTYIHVHVGAIIVEIFSGFNFGHFWISLEFLISGGI